MPRSGAPHSPLPCSPSGRRSSRPPAPPLRRRCPPHRPPSSAEGPRPPLDPTASRWSKRGKSLNFSSLTMFGNKFKSRFTWCAALHQKILATRLRQKSLMRCLGDSAYWWRNMTASGDFFFTRHAPNSFNWSLQRLSFSSTEPMEWATDGGRIIMLI